MSFVQALTGVPHLRKKVELATIDASVGLPLADLTDLPFRVIDHGLRFEVTFEASARLTVKLRRGFFARAGVVHDGAACRVSGSDTRISVQAQFGEELVFSKPQGVSWIVRYEFERERRLGFSAVQFKGLLQPLLRASAGHVLVALLAVSAFHGLKYVPGFAELIAGQDRGAVAWLGTQTTQARLPDPFSGMGIRAFERAAAEEYAARDAARPDAASRASRVIGNLLGKFKLAALTDKGSAAPAAGEKIDTGSIVASVLAARQSKVTAPAPVAPSAMPQKPGNVLAGVSRQDAVIRRALDDIKPRLTRAYDEALKIDPGISVTLAYEGVVDPRGSVSEVRIRAKGRYSPAALAALEQGVKLALMEVHIGREHAGTVLRGEQVFVR